MRVLALDPGERVGYARADVDGLDLRNLTHGIVELWPMAETTHTALMAQRYDVVVCEKWVLFPGKEKHFIGSEFPSVQFIGSVRLSCRLSGTKYVGQPSAKKKIADKLLPQHWPDIWEMVSAPRRHDDGHDADALRHLAFWTWKNA